MSRVAFKHDVPPEIASRYAEYGEINCITAFDVDTGIHIGVLVYGSYRLTRVHRVLSLVVDRFYRRTGVATELLKVLRCIDDFKIIACIDDAKDLNVGIFCLLGFKYAGIYGRLTESSSMLTGVKLEYAGVPADTDTGDYTVELEYLKKHDDNILFNLDGPR